MNSFVVLGSIAWDEVVDLDGPLRTGSHNGGRWRGGRVGGGAANTAMALARAGARVHLVSAAGPDAAGRSIIAQLEALGVDTSFVDRQADQTTRSLVLLDARGERTVVNLARAVVAVPAGIETVDASWLYVRSGDPGLAGLLARRVGRGGRVLAHVPPVQTGIRPAQVLVGSASDLDEAFLADPFAAGERIAGDVLEWMVLTDGAGGAGAYGRDDRLGQPAPDVEVVDSTGAGDVFAAGLLYALANGAAMAEALGTAVRWGSASVRYDGTVPPEGFPSLR